MFPELFKIPGLGIPLATYGVLLAIGFILALWLAARLAARDGLPKQRIYDLGLYVLAAGLVGSKALMVITEWNDYGGDWRRMLSVDFLRSGGVFYGGLLAAVAASVIFMLRITRVIRGAFIGGDPAQASTNRCRVDPDRPRRPGVRKWRRARRSRAERLDNRR